MPDIKSMNLAELTAYLEDLGEKGYRAKQLYAWMHQKQVTDYDRMENLPKALRQRLAAESPLTVLSAVQMQESAQDGTRKYLFALPDGNLVESVLMRYRHGNSVCISSQVGCRMGCRFCASTLDGLVRGLTPAEMLEQIYWIGADLGERISHVVVMGTGEPLDNYDNLLRFLRLLTDENGLHLSQRNVTVSTCGIVPRIRQLAEEELAITLALSLHAPTQEKRLALMPVAGAYALPEVLDACRYYFARTGRRVTFEYALIRGENDGREDAEALCGLIGGLHGHVNLIPVNPVRERGYAASGQRTVRAFQEVLQRRGIAVTVRRELGRDIDGACGQLRKKQLALSEKM